MKSFDTLYNEPRIYAYSLPEVGKLAGWLKVGYTDRQTADERIRQQLKTPMLGYHIEVNEPAVCGGRFFRDSAVHKILEDRGFKRARFEDVDAEEGGKKGKKSEWFKCGVDDVKAAIKSLQGLQPQEERKNLANFQMRPEQFAAVMQTADYFRRNRRQKDGQPPFYLWNAKMRFGKTFTTYQLAKEMKWTKILVLTFKPAVEDSWQKDLESHVDFHEWQFVSNSEGTLNWRQADKRRPIVWFGSFQDFLGLDKTTGEYKVRNQEAFDVEWDCVVVDEYHFGAWRSENRQFTGSIEDDESVRELGGADAAEFKVEKSPLKARSYLMLSGTPFRAIQNGEFDETQIFNWTYSDEQNAKYEWPKKNPGEPNPYAALPRMNMFVYKLPDRITRVAENADIGFDLNEFFRAEREKGARARFVHEDEVSKWLDFMRGEFFVAEGAKPVLPYYDVELKRALRHVVWYLPNVASCEAMLDLLKSGYHSTFYQQYEVNPSFGSYTGVGKDALESVDDVIQEPLSTMSITLTCGKLTTGVTIPAWSAIFMLRNLSSPETYFQAAFRVQSPWTMKNLDGKSPNEETVLKENCYVFDFALNRALKQIADYSANLTDKTSVPAENVRNFINFMPVICYDGSKMIDVEAGEILDLAYSGMSGPAMARRWNSANLINISPQIVEAILNNGTAMAAIKKIQGFANPRGEMQSFINRTEKINKLKAKARNGDKKAKKELTEEERLARKERAEIEKKLRKFVTRIPIFMYLSDYREKALVDVIRNIESDLFTQVTGLTLADFETLIDFGVFNSAQMNSCIWQFRAYEEESLDYLHVRDGLVEDSPLVGGWDSSVSKKDAYESLMKG